MESQKRVKKTLEKISFENIVSIVDEKVHFFRYHESGREISRNGGGYCGSLVNGYSDVGIEICSIGFESSGSRLED